MDKGKIVLGSDHAGFQYKQKAKALLEGLGFECHDMGVTGAQSADYPPIGRDVARAVASGEARWGVLVCGSGVGMSIAANRVPGARAALCYSEQVAGLTREHNDANIIVLGERTMSWPAAEKALRAFFATEFSGEERHARRVKQIEEG